MTHLELRQRTQGYAVAVAEFAQGRDGHLAGRHAAAQLVRASASVAANYRAAGVARSHKEFIAKLGVVIEEADECVFWLEYIEATTVPTGPDLAALKDEAQQLLRIFASSRSTARRNSRR